MNQNEIAEKIATMEQEQARAREALQNALQQAEEGKAVLQRQQGYLIALRELLQVPGEENGEVVSPLETEVEVLT